MQNSKIR